MIEIERTQIHFISDVLLAVAVLASSVIWCYLILTSKNIMRVLKKHSLTPSNAGVETRIAIHYSLLAK